MMKQLYILLIGLSSTFTYAQDTTELRPVQTNIWLTLNGGATSFTGFVIGKELNVSTGHRLFSLDYQSYDGPIDLFHDSPNPKMKQYSAYYGYIENERTRFWYAKAGLSYLLYSSVSDTIKGTGWFNGDKYSYKTSRLMGVSGELGAGFKLWLISFQAYGSVLISGPETIANLGLKVGIGYLE